MSICYTIGTPCQPYSAQSGKKIKKPRRVSGVRGLGFSDAKPASFLDCHCHLPQFLELPAAYRNEPARAYGCPAVVFSPQHRSAHPPEFNDELVFKAFAETGCVDSCCTAWHNTTSIGKHTVISSKDWFCSRHRHCSRLVFRLSRPLPRHPQNTLSAQRVNGIQENLERFLECHWIGWG